MKAPHPPPQSLPPCLNEYDVVEGNTRLMPLKGKAVIFEVSLLSLEGVVGQSWTYL